jgi:hypothetical protein
MGETAPSFVLRTRTTWERAMLTCVPRHDGVTTGQGVHSGGSRGTVSSGRDGARDVQGSCSRRTGWRQVSSEGVGGLVSGASGASGASGVLAVVHIRDCQSSHRQLVVSGL